MWIPSPCRHDLIGTAGVERLHPGSTTRGETDEWRGVGYDRCVISQSTGQKFDSSEDINLTVLRNLFRDQTLFSNIMIYNHKCKKRVWLIKKRTMLKLAGKLRPIGRQIDKKIAVLLVTLDHPKICLSHHFRISGHHQEKFHSPWWKKL